MKYNRIIGVDVAKNKLDIYNSKTQQHQVIDNSPAAIAFFLCELKRGRTRTLVVMEATGGYEHLLVEQLLDKSIDCSVVNPLQIRNFAKGCGMIEKNDKLDARIIARFGEVVTPKLREKPSDSEAKLKSLVHRRDQILSQISAERNRLQQTPDEETKTMIHHAIHFYKAQIRTVDQRISQVLEECAELTAKA
ncbi:transposase, partial [Aeoliella sp. ICT_H6.2]